MKSTRLKIKSKIDARTGEMRKTAVQARFRTDGLVGFSEHDGATRMQTAGDGDNFDVEEIFDDVAQALTGELVTVTALHCVDDDAETASSRPPTRMSLNPDKFTYRKHGKRAVISIEGVPRDLVVMESVTKIEKMIDEVS